MPNLLKPCLLILMLPLAATAASAESDPADPSAAASQLLADALQHDGGAGIAAAVLNDGQLRFAGAVGYADLESHRQMTVDTPARIGSVSKIITAALVARLIDAGELTADSDIHALVPEFPRRPEQPAAITPRLLANHTSGIRHYDFANRTEANNQHYYPDLAQALAQFADESLLAPPGDAFHYSSFGFNLLGVAAARAVDASFAAAVEQWVAEPLGLSRTGIDHPLQLIAGRARFYTVWQGSLINTYWRDSSDYYPSGGMLSSAADLARLSAAMFEGDFLGQSARQLLLEESQSSSGPTGYSFGWQVKTGPDGRIHYEHGGETNGAYAWLYYNPETLTAVAGVANYNVFPSTAEPAFFATAMAGLVDLYAQR